MQDDRDNVSDAFEGDDEPMEDACGSSDVLASDNQHSQGSLGIAEDHDTLNYACRFKITMSFELERHKASRRYGHLNVSVEGSEDGEGNLSSKLRDDRVVDLRYCIRTTGSYLSSSSHGCCLMLFAKPGAAIFRLSPKTLTLGL